MAISAALPVSTLSCCASHSTKKDSFGQILRKDHEFIKRGFEKLKSNYLPVISKTVNDVFWMRNFENPNTNLEPPISPPPPFYPGLSGVDLMMADLEAIWEYAHYFYHAAKLWSRPLPDIYDPETVADYFKRRPHIVAFRVLEVLSSFASAVVKMRISKILNLKTGAIKDGSRNSSEYYMGHLLKETMLNLGPTFIKVGQSLSTRPDIIGSQISKVLSELHDQIPPFPSAVAMEIIEEELGCPVETIFSYISEEPVAAASFGQVYRSCTIDGCTVAVKVQRPNLHHSVLRDIYILRLGLALLQQVAKRKSDLSLYADELGKGFVGELDYTIEAANASEFLESHARFPFIYVPKILGHLSRKRVLTMEWVVGESPNKLLNQSRGLGLHDVEYSERQVEARTHLLDLVNKGVEATLVQLLETGLLHADPHAGNLRYTPAGQIGFLDFGLVCRMERKHQFAMLASILHIVNGAWDALVYDLMEMDVVRPGTNLRHVTMELEDSLGEVVFKDGIPDIKFSKVLGKIWSVAIKYHFRMPPYYTLLLRSLASFEGLAVAADPNFKTFQAAYPYVVRKLLTDNSAVTRRILHSVVFNKRKEFQWHKLAAFLKVSATRKGIQGIISIERNSPPQNIQTRQNGALEIAQLILRLLPSKDGAVLRRMLMTADPTSLIRAMISKEAVVYRHHLCQALADLLHQWMVQSLSGNNTVSPPPNSRVIITSIHHNRKVGPSESSALFNSVLLTDRRLKVIYSRVLKALRKDPILMLRFYWTCFIMSISASALACHRQLVFWYKMYISSVHLLPKRFAVSV